MLRVGRDPEKQTDGKTTRERLRGCYVSWSRYNIRREIGRRWVQLCNNLLIDLLPEPAVIRDVWKYKLALVKGKRAGSVVAPER